MAPGRSGSRRPRTTVSATPPSTLPGQSEQPRRRREALDPDQEGRWPRPGSDRRGPAGSARLPQRAHGSSSSARRRATPDSPTNDPDYIKSLGDLSGTLEHHPVPERPRRRPQRHRDAEADQGAERGAHLLWPPPAWSSVGGRSWLPEPDEKGRLFTCRARTASPRAAARQGLLQQQGPIAVRGEVPRRVQEEASRASPL